MTRKLGNPQLGVADVNNPHPPIECDGEILGYMSICEDCGGYYWAECPCWFRKGGRYYAPPVKTKMEWWPLIILLVWFALVLWGMSC